ncbi:MliC family protein [Paracoccus onubensis]|uniref:MliC family protein n=1 Tax=Paracoccus onubensis TaxID=1675788 RepID=UPI0027311790|nr:MliC family protein [Paracoccus onubensis]MDP0928499.1 MliC family protein [Paracoccus onubensis]
MRWSFIIAMASIAALPANAEAVLSIPLPLTEESSVIPTDYDCPDSGKVSVSYINAGENSLAILSIDEIERVFVNVISASGARYVAGQYEWWSKGDIATFTDLTKEDSAEECTS